MNIPLLRGKEVQVKEKIIFVALVFVGVAILCCGGWMSKQTTETTETQYRTTQTESSDKGHCATVGAVVGVTSGAVTCGAVAAFLGGFGLAICGTGVGAPAGAALIIIAALCGGAAGAASGAVIGAAVGTTTATITTVPYTVTTVFPTYTDSQCSTVVGIGIAFLVAGAMYVLYSIYRSSRGDAKA